MPDAPASIQQLLQEHRAQHQSIKVLSKYMPLQLGQERDSRIARARQWLLETVPASVDDGAYRILGLNWSGASVEELQTAAKTLTDWQRAEGSWGQFHGRSSDAYATGEALAALKLTGTISDEKYARRRSGYRQISPRTVPGW